MKQTATNNNNFHGPILWSIVIFLVLKPIYLFDSGRLQPGDFFLVLCIGYYLIKSKIKIPWNGIGSYIVFFMFCLIAWQCLINLSWYSTSLEINFLIASTFYLFNFIAFLFFAHLGLKNSIAILKRSMAYGAIVSAGITLLGIMLMHGNSVRGTGFFNNPNQLGFHGTLLMTILFFTRAYLNKFFRGLLWSLSVFFVASSASKAAFGGIVCLSVAYILFSEQKFSIKNNVWKIVLIGIVGSLLYSFFFALQPVSIDNNFLSTMQYRIVHMNDKADSNLTTGRGYARVFEMEHHVLWGMGEGDYYRFSTLSGLEIHSMFVNLIVSYGLIGFLGYVCVFGYAIIGCNLKITLYNLAGFSGIFIYTLTHNGIRNTLVWLLLALLCVQKIKFRQSKYVKDSEK